jgi:AcrR family transcriptional regulator
MPSTQLARARVAPRGRGIELEAQRRLRAYAESGFPVMSKLSKNRSGLLRLSTLSYVSCPPSSGSRPLRADAERNRRRLLSAAGELFAEKGLCVGLDEVARHAGVGVATAYRRFSDKQELIEALFEERIAHVVALAERALVAEDPWAGLVQFMEGAVRMHACDRGLKQLVFGNEVSAARLEAGRRRIHPLVAQLVERAQAAGSLRDDVTATDLALLQFILSGAADFTTSAGPELSQRYLTIMLDGLRTSNPTRLSGRAPRELAGSSARGRADQLAGAAGDFPGAA